MQVGGNGSYDWGNKWWEKAFDSAVATVDDSGSSSDSSDSDSGECCCCRALGDKDACMWRTHTGSSW